MPDKLKQLHFVKDDEAGDADSQRGRELSRAVDGEPIYVVEDAGRTAEAAAEIVGGPLGLRPLKFAKDRKRSIDLGR